MFLSNLSFWAKHSLLGFRDHRCSCVASGLSAFDLSLLTLFCLCYLWNTAFSVSERHQAFFLWPLHMAAVWKYLSLGSNFWFSLFGVFLSPHLIPFLFCFHTCVSVLHPYCKPFAIHFLPKEYEVFESKSSICCGPNQVPPRPLQLSRWGALVTLKQGFPVWPAEG